MKFSATLITNLRFVSIDNVRTHTSALVLLAGPSSGFAPRAERDKPDLRIRGFGTDAAWETFDIMGLASLEYQVEPGASRDLFISDSRPEPRPLFTGGIMQIKDGPRLDLIAEDGDREIDFSAFVEDDGPDSHARFFDHLWGAIPAKVASYWRAPGFPSLAWGPTSLVTGAPRRRRF